MRFLPTTTRCGLSDPFPPNVPLSQTYRNQPQHLHQDEACNVEVTLRGSLCAQPWETSTCTTVGKKHSHMVCPDISVYVQTKCTDGRDETAQEAPQGRYLACANRQATHQGAGSRRRTAMAVQFIASPLQQPMLIFAHTRRIWSTTKRTSSHFRRPTPSFPATRPLLQWRY